MLWWDQDDPQLSANVRTAIADTDNRVFVSAASHLPLAISPRTPKQQAPSRGTQLWALAD